MQCEALLQMIQDRRDYLLETIELDKEHKLRVLKVINSAFEEIITKKFTKSFKIFDLQITLLLFSP